MNNLIKISAALTLFTAPALACEYPERPNLPDGNIAAKEEMIAAQSTVKEFLAKVDEYLICIEQ